MELILSVTVAKVWPGAMIGGFRFDRAGVSCGSSSCYDSISGLGLRNAAR